MEDNILIIASATDMCCLLQNTEQPKAVDFARVQHEQACRNQSHDRMQFWEDVMLLLAASKTVTG